MPSERFRRIYLRALFWSFILVWVLLGINPVYRSDWFLENILVFLAVPFVWFVHRKWPLSNLSYTLIFLFLTLHSIGAHYTYSEVPFGRWVSDIVGWERNHFDRMVHFLWGFLIGMPIFEILNRRVRGRRRAIIFFTLSVIVLVGVLYEFMEWAAALVVAPEAGTAFLGTQGDEWDAQKDLLLNLLGGMASLIFLPTVLRQTRQQSSTTSESGRPASE
jgi:putative membrane protein